MDDDWRGIHNFEVNGHRMFRMSEEEMGGGCSGISIGCWTCSRLGRGSKISTYSFWEWPGEKVYTVNEALLQANKDMWKHAHPERVR